MPEKAFSVCIKDSVFIDPAAGSGNFLTESYLSLRKLENEALRLLLSGKMVGLDVDQSQFIRVDISQFYGIEINDFAVTVARTALWIAENQMMKATEDIVHTSLDFLPLKTNAHIVEGNALRIDWNDVVPKDKLNYIMGNPPFVGYSMQNKSQKDDIINVYVDQAGKPYKSAGKIDYVAGWYYKAAQLLYGTSIHAALVSTNSITQGEQVSSIWKPLFERFDIHIDFAYRTFRWDSEASIKAHVHCVIIGFSFVLNSKKRTIYAENQIQKTDNINAYLIDSINIFIDSRSVPLDDAPIMQSGGKPVEGGFLIFSENEKNDFINAEPRAASYFKPFIGADDFINGYSRWCLWLEHIRPNELKSMPLVLKRVECVKTYRLKSKKESTRACAVYPHLFMEVKKSGNPCLIIPEVSSEKRRYLPIGYAKDDVICSNTVRFISHAQLFHFGVLESNVHMAWMRTVAGRLEMRYRYSANIVYNNFPWPEPTDEQKAKIEQTAQAILDARALYPDASLADLYDPLTMPQELRKAHQANDRAVMQAYGMPIKETDEAACVAWLMRLYQQKVSEQL